MRARETDKKNHTPDWKSAHVEAVYYDGSCPLCRKEIAWYLKHPSSERVGFIDITRHPDEVTAAGLSCSAAMSRFHVSTSDGNFLSGSRAFVALWRTMGLFKPLTALARVPGVIQVMELSYRLWLPMRPILSRLLARRGAKAAQ